VASLKSHRNALGISQSKLARLSGVSRFKICTFELGDNSLTLDEQHRIKAALETEVERLRNLATRIDLVNLRLTGEADGPPILSGQIADRDATDGSGTGEPT